MKYLSFLSISLMIFGGAWFILEAYSLQTINTNIELVDEAVPLGIWMDKGTMLETDLENNENELESNKVWNDIKNHWAKDSIMYIVGTQVMSPITENEFMPNKYVTRAEFLTTLGRTENIDTMDRQVKNIVDVDMSKYYAPYIAWAEEKSIIELNNTNRFRPNDLITREEVAVMLVNYLENVRNEILIGGTGIKDLDEISKENQDKVMLAIGSEYIGGRNDGNFDPKTGMTRAELATILTRMIKRLDL